MELNFSIVYSTSLASLNAERSNLYTPLSLNKFVSTQLKQTINQLRKVILTIKKTDIELNNIYLERKCYVSNYDFEGIITKIEDIDNTNFEVTIYEPAWHFTRRIYKIEDTGIAVKEYEIDLTLVDDFIDFLQNNIIDSMNTNMPADLQWVLGEDIPANIICKEKVNDKNYYEMLQLFAKHAITDLFFIKNKVYFAKQGKTINLDPREQIFKKITSSIDLDTFGNIVTVVGAKEAGVNLVATEEVVQNKLQYDYERVVTNNNLTTQKSVDNVAVRVIDEYNNVNPDVNLELSKDLIQQYNLQLGDVFSISSDSITQSVKGFYRVIKLDIDDTKADVTLQYSIDGKFIPRLMDSIDLFAAILNKQKNIEINT